jgi:hypothetical protein
MPLNPPARVSFLYCHASERQRPWGTEKLRVSPCFPIHEWLVGVAMRSDQGPEPEVGLCIRPGCPAIARMQCHLEGKVIEHPGRHLSD